MCSIEVGVCAVVRTRGTLYSDHVGAGNKGLPSPCRSRVLKSRHALCDYLRPISDRVRTQSLPCPHTKQALPMTTEDISYGGGTIGSVLSFSVFLFRVLRSLCSRRAAETVFCLDFGHAGCRTGFMTSCSCYSAQDRPLPACIRHPVSRSPIYIY